MPLPLEIQHFCNEYLLAVRADPQHEFSLTDRLNLYRSFYPGQYNQPVDTNTVSFNPFAEQSPIKVTLPDHAMGWLGVLAARKVAPLWERVWEQTGLTPETVTSPYEVLHLCEDCLWGNTSLEEALKESCGDINLGGNIGYFTTYEVGDVYSTAYEALICIATNHSTLKEVLTNEKLTYQDNYDVAKVALSAFTVQDRNPPGLWFEVGLSKRDRNESQNEYEDIEAFPDDTQWPPNSPIEQIITDFEFKQAKNLKNFIPFEFDIQKRLEFWEWWLEEAVPQAWELGEQSWSGVVRQV